MVPASAVSETRFSARRRPKVAADVDEIAALVKSERSRDLALELRVEVLERGHEIARAATA